MRLNFLSVDGFGAHGVEFVWYDRLGLCIEFLWGGDMSWSLNAVAIAASILLSQGAFAACTNDTSGAGVSMLSAGTCEPQYATYAGTGAGGAMGPVYAGGNGALVSITRNTTATNSRGRATGGSFYASGGTARIVSVPGVTLTSDTTTGSYVHGFRANGYGVLDIQGDAVGTIRSSYGRAMLVDPLGVIRVHGKTTLTVADTAGSNSRALALEGGTAAVADSLIELLGDVNVSLINDSARVVTAVGGTLKIGGHLNATGYAGKTGIDGIRMLNGPVDIQLNTFELNEVAAIGIFVEASTNPLSFSAAGAGNIRSSKDGFIALNHAGSNGTVSFGPNTTIAMTGANATAVRLVAGARFAAGAGFTVDESAVFDSQTAFDLRGANQPIALTDARVHTNVLWLSNDAGTNLSFTGHGGSYRGTAGIAQGTLNLALDSGAVWAVTNDSSLGAAGQVTLAGNAVLDASVKGGATGLAGDVLNNGGVVTLQQVSASPSDVLQTRRYTANGGQLLLDTTLNDASSSISDVLQASEVVAGGAPTQIFVRPTAVSSGALTTGKGILVVSVTGTSAPDAFVLGAPVSHNGFDYLLVQDAGDGNWYLRSQRAVPPVTPGAALPVPAGTPWGLAALGALLAAAVARQRRR